MENQRRHSCEGSAGVCVKEGFAVKNVWIVGGEKRSERRLGNSILKGKAIIKLKSGIVTEGVVRHFKTLEKSN